MGTFLQAGSIEGGEVSGTIVLSSNNEAIFERVPDWMNMAPASGTGNTINLRGTWSLRKAYGRWAISVQSVRGSSDLLFDVPIGGQSKPFKLVITIGDPDEGKVVEFVQR